MDCRERIGGDEPNAFRYNVGLAYVMAHVKGSVLQFPTPVVEVNGTRTDSGENVVDLTTGFRVQVGKKGLFGIAYSFPVSNRREFDGQLIVSMIYHFRE